jgi:hypothetical protein
MFKRTDGIDVIEGVKSVENEEVGSGPRGCVGTRNQRVAGPTP